MKASRAQKHFILVHGACHGAWSWYKLKPLLEAAGHKVTAIDLAASGVNTAKQIHELHSFHDYSLPLLDLMGSLPPDEKVILVGHSLGGMNIALASDRYPEKVSVAVFLAALLPDTAHVPAYPLHQYIERRPGGAWLDTQFYPSPGQESGTVILFGPEYLSSIVYPLCSAEEVELAKMLVRPGSLFLEDLSRASNFSEEGFGSVEKAYIVCNQDLTISTEFQWWQIENARVTEVKELHEADHTAMISSPQEVCQCLLEIANKFN